MNAPEKFAFRPAVREQTPLLIGIVGPSGAGKTMSALRLATGIQSVVGGRIAAIDTEARRMLHYASRFDFDYLEFGQPFGSDRYLQAVLSAVEAGAKTIIVDSMSHEHEGPGGHLDFHDQEVKRLLSEGGFKSEFAAQIPAWTKPAGRRRRLINGLLQVPVNMIFCFRAKEKIKLVKRNGRTEPVELGWQAIAGEEFVYEMTDRFLLVPGCQGRPAFNDDAMATGVPKLPDEHREFFPEGAQLNEDIGAALAQWAVGKPGPLGDDVVQAFAAIGVTPRQITERLGREATAHDTKALKAWYRELKTKKPGTGSTPTDRPDTNADPKDSTAPTGDAPEHPQAGQDRAGDANASAAVVKYAVLADRIHKAADRDAALLVLDEGRALPVEQQKELAAVFANRFPD
jgi:energy-coupling factor transporter ATP-binding protein EcfA2